MTVRIHFLMQALVVLLHALNYFGPLTSPAAKPWVAFALTVCQATLALINHYYTPDGKRIPNGINQVGPFIYPK